LFFYMLTSAVVCAQVSVAVDQHSPRCSNYIRLSVCISHGIHAQDVLDWPRGKNQDTSMQGD
jgi:hypothetical protein